MDVQIFDYYHICVDFLISVNFCSLFMALLIVHVQLEFLSLISQSFYNYYTALCPGIFFFIKSSLSDNNTSIPVFWCIRFAGSIFFYPFSYLALKCISSKQHIIGSFFKSSLKTLIFQMFVLLILIIQLLM